MSTDPCCLGNAPPPPIPHPRPSPPKFKAACSEGLITGPVLPLLYTPGPKPNNGL